MAKANMGPEFKRYQVTVKLSGPIVEKLIELMEERGMKTARELVELLIDEESNA